MEPEGVSALEYVTVARTCGLTLPEALAGWIVDLADRPESTDTLIDSWDVEAASLAPGRHRHVTAVVRRDLDRARTRVGATTWMSHLADLEDGVTWRRTCVWQEAQRDP